MIKVGITENIELVKAEINDKGTLVIGLKKGGGMSLAERLSSSSESSSVEDSQEFFIWPLAMGEYVKTSDDVARETESLRRMLVHILKGYLQEDEIKKGFNPFNGIDLEKPEEEIEKMLVTDTVLAKIYNNMITQFIEMVSPFIGKGMKFRVKLNRQSKLKAFSSFPKVGQYVNLDREAFWESMDIKKEASNVKYSNYEKGFRKGDKDTPSGTDLSSDAQVATASVADPKEAEAAAKMFGTPTE